MDFDNRKVYGDTSITDGLVFNIRKSNDIVVAMISKSNNNTRTLKPAHQEVLAGKTLPPARAF